MERKSIRKEETKVNFFSLEEQKGLYDLGEQEEDQQILETKIDPLEWNKEIDRVYGHLVKIEEELEFLKKQGGDTSNDFDEFRRHIELIIEMCNDIKQSSHHEVRKVFSHSIESLDNDL